MTDRIDERPDTARAIPGIEAYDAPAGGWGALKAVGAALKGQHTLIGGGRSLLKANQPDGFDCPGCAWPDPKHNSSFEFCENGAKAVAWEATKKRAGLALFETHTVTELLNWSDFALEDTGRLTHPMAYDPASDRYLAIEWDEAFSRIAAALAALDHPDEAEFYASGRASNEAAFLYQVLGRRFGTNNFPDCSNMCHEPTSVALPDALGLGKGSVTLEDFDHADLILCFGHNPGTNHPRMMATLRDAARRGAGILAFNPLKERALERFASPQDPVEMATLSATPIASRYYQPKLGGDFAVLQGMMKAVLEAEAAAQAAGQPPVLDHQFIAQETSGFEALAEQIANATWPELEAASGLTRAQMEEAGGLYAKAKAVILCYGMGLTQHRNAASSIHQLVNLLLLRGNIGREGAGICPLRGHSNVQGDRTVGVWEKPTEAFLAAMDNALPFRSPRHHGHTVVEAIAAMEAGKSRFFMGLGGNFAVAAPDPVRTFAAMRKVGMTVHVATKLNRTHLLPGAQSLLLPCLGRTEFDQQATGHQSVTVEDSMSMVHASRGLNAPASPALKSEVAIVAGVGKALFGGADPFDWDAMVANYDLIREMIERVLPEAFKDYNTRIRTPGGFRLPVAPSERVWKTKSGKANFLLYTPAPDPRGGDPAVLLLTTLRSHDQYNTTIYGVDDRYRGVFGRRDVVFVNPDDMRARGLRSGDLVDLVAAFDSSNTRRIEALTIVERDIPAGCIAGYYPETNVLVQLDDHDARSGTPAYKSVPVTLARHQGAQETVRASA